MFAEVNTDFLIGKDSNFTQRILRSIEVIPELPNIYEVITNLVDEGYRVLTQKPEGNFKVLDNYHFQPVKNNWGFQINNFQCGITAALAMAEKACPGSFLINTLGYKVNHRTSSILGSQVNSLNWQLRVVTKNEYIVLGKNALDQYILNLR